MWTSPIYGEQYGWVAPGMDVSGLEDEYLAAVDLPKLTYIHEPKGGDPARSWAAGGAGADLRARLKRRRMDSGRSILRAPAAWIVAFLVEGSCGSWPWCPSSAAWSGSSGWYSGWARSWWPSGGAAPQPRAVPMILSA